MARLMVAWRENRTRQRQESIQERALEQARREFVSKEDAAALKTAIDNRTVLAVLAVGLYVAMNWPDKKD